MPVMSDIEVSTKVSESPVDENIAYQSDNTSYSSMNPVKTIYIGKKEKENKQVSIELKIQEYADRLYEQHGYGTDYEKSLFIAELVEKFPGLDDYGKYYDSAKKLFEISV